ncbi:MAG: CheB methylesterase domain-containing protein, partial [Candidatus Aquicultor sp.]
RDGRGFYVDVKDGPPVNRHKPSVDVLFRSAAHSAGAKAIGVILTGMGSDGAQGMLEMKEAGAFNIAQSKESCVVFGMPKSAIEKGAVDKVARIDSMPSLIMQQLKAAG